MSQYSPSNISADLNYLRSPKIGDKLVQPIPTIPIQPIPVLQQQPQLILPQQQGLLHRTNPFENAIRALQTPRSHQWTSGIPSHLLAFLGNQGKKFSIKQVAIDLQLPEYNKNTDYSEAYWNLYLKNEDLLKQLEAQSEERNKVL